MKKFKTFTGIAAPLNMTNVDTDIIIPKQFLKTIKRSGLGIHAFHDIRYHEDGRPREDFTPNRKEYSGAQILVTGENFGCGSSREHAPWAIADMGIQCIIAPSFADIFYNNAFKNGILPIRLSEANVMAIMNDIETTPGTQIEINLEEQTIRRGNILAFDFDIDPFRKHCLINGLDDIGLTLEKQNAIKKFEEMDQEKRSWLYQ